MTKILKDLCNSLEITEDSLPNRNRFIYNGDEERKQLTDPIRNDEKLTYRVVSQYTQLKKVGKHYFGLCPFPDHEDTNPSFTILFVKEMHRYEFRCFGCEKRKDEKSGESYYKSGDLFDLIEELDGIGFTEALQHLWAIKMKLDHTEKIPVLKGKGEKKWSNKTIQEQAPAVSQKNPIKPSNPLYSGNKTLPEEETKEQRLRICRFITEFCHKYLLSNDPDAQKALKYLIEERGLTKEFIRAQKIGFYQKKAMFIEDMQDKAGYSITMVGKVLPDSFDGYVLFPIRDTETSDVLGFIGRLVVEDGQRPKYITKNNECYTRSENLYLMNAAIKAIRDKRCVFIVEGIFDALLMHQRGAMNTVSLLGSEISDKQLDLIKKCTEGKNYKKCLLADVWMFLDNDKKGREASKQICEKITKAGLSVMTVKTYQPWKDPAELICWVNQEKNPSYHDYIAEYSFRPPAYLSPHSRLKSFSQLDKCLSYPQCNNFISGDTIQKHLKKDCYNNIVCKWKNSFEIN